MVLSSLAMVEPGANVSRIDLFADFVSPHALDSWDDNAWVSRAKYLDRHRQGQVCTGWTIGRGGIVLARLYDKTVQVLASGQDYLYDLWRAQGWDGQSSVYRIEFQFRAEALRPMGCNRYPEVLDQLGGLWRYATEKWLRLTIPSADDTTRSRWPTHPMWEALQSHPWTPCEPVSRIPIPDGKCPSLARVYSSYAAALTSFMATEGIENPHDAFQWLHEKSQRYYDERAQFTGQDFETFILGRASRKALDYGRPFEFTTLRAREEQIEAIARQYRDESRR